MAEQFSLFIKAVRETVVDSIDNEYADYLIETLDVIVTELIKKQEEEVDVEMCK